MYLHQSTNLLWIVVILSVFASCTPQKEVEWTSLLDKDLSRWEKYLGYRHQNGYNGDAPTDSSGNLTEPIGYNNDEMGVFTMREENGEPILHVSGEVYGCVYTKQEYQNYHLSLQVKWGEKVWEPRESFLKDSGLLYHSIGEAGVDYWRAWMLSQEFQIMEGHMGDYWSIANAAIDVRAFIPEGMISSIASHSQPFLPIGSGTGNDGFCLRSSDYTRAENDWETMELICFEDKSLHVVNGEVVMVLQNSRYYQDSTYYPLTKGKIQLQSEAAEVFYKDVKIRSIDQLPQEYANYF